MKLIHAIRHVDRSKENTHDADVEWFAELFDIDIQWSKEFSDRVKQHYIKLWLCTDTWVGLSTFYFDGEPVAIGRQPSRGRSIQIQFLSDECAERIRKFIVSLTIDDSAPPKFSILDPNEDIGDDYQIQYASNVICRAAVHNGAPVSIARTSLPKILEEHVQVVNESGDIFSVHISELKFPLKVVRHPEAIAVEHENPAELKEWDMGLSRLQEDCALCASPTRYWHTDSNTPCCEGCAFFHSVPELLAAKATNLAMEKATRGN